MHRPQSVRLHPEPRHRMTWLGWTGGSGRREPLPDGPNVPRSVAPPCPAAAALHRARAV
ncbi:protein of unknown function [Streptomyces sp. KY75]|nr:protein of unknown function [Streptomyces sp. KY75]CAD5994525.1 protein of unknown function [Streptomyces sp. KY70]